MSADDITEWLQSGRDTREFDESHPLPNLPSVTWNCGVEEARKIKVSLADFGQGRAHRLLPHTCAI